MKRRKFMDSGAIHLMGSLPLVAKRNYFAAYSFVNFSFMIQNSFYFKEISPIFNLTSVIEAPFSFFVCSSGSNLKNLVLVKKFYIQFATTLLDEYLAL